MSKPYPTLFSIMDPSAMPVRFYEPGLIQQINDVSLYPVIHSKLSHTEDEDGNYDYSEISNIGMIYLFVHRKDGKRDPSTKTEYIRELLQFYRRAAETGIRIFVP